jgi:hypothetical protein
MRPYALDHNRGERPQRFRPRHRQAVVPMIRAAANLALYTIIAMLILARCAS